MFTPGYSLESSGELKKFLKPGVLSKPIKSVHPGVGLGHLWRICAPEVLVCWWGLRVADLLAIQTKLWVSVQHPLREEIWKFFGMVEGKVGRKQRGEFSLVRVPESQRALCLTFNIGHNPIIPDFQKSCKKSTQNYLILFTSQS